MNEWDQESRSIRWSLYCIVKCHRHQVIRDMQVIKHDLCNAVSVEVLVVYLIVYDGFCISQVVLQSDAKWSTSAMKVQRKTHHVFVSRVGSTNYKRPGYRAGHFHLPQHRPQMGWHVTSLFHSVSKTKTQPWTVNYGELQTSNFEHVIYDDVWFIHD